MLPPKERKLSCGLVTEVEILALRRLKPGFQGLAVGGLGAPATAGKHVLSNLITNSGPKVAGSAGGECCETTTAVPTCLGPHLGHLGQPSQRSSAILTCYICTPRRWLPFQLHDTGTLDPNSGE